MHCTSEKMAIKSQYMYLFLKEYDISAYIICKCEVSMQQHDIPVNMYWMWNVIMSTPKLCYPHTQTLNV